MFLPLRDLSDVDKDGRLSVDEFAIAMHLIDKAKKGLTLPSTLPSELTLTSGGETQVILLYMCSVRALTELFFSFLSSLLCFLSSLLLLSISPSLALTFFFPSFLSPLPPSLPPSLLPSLPLSVPLLQSNQSVRISPLLQLPQKYLQHLKTRGR